MDLLFIYATTVMKWKKQKQRQSNTRGYYDIAHDQHVQHENSRFCNKNEKFCTDSRIQRMFLLNDLVQAGSWYENRYAKDITKAITT